MDARTTAERPIAARDKRVFLYAVSLALDCFALLSGYGVALLLRDQRWLEPEGHPLIALALPIFVMFLIAREAQSVETLQSRSLGVSRALSALGATALVLMMLTFLLKAEEISRLGFAITFAAGALFLVVSRVILDQLFNSMMKGVAVKSLLVLDGAAAKPDPEMDMIDLGREDLWPDLSRPDKIDALSRIFSNYDRVVVACQSAHRSAWSTFLKGSDVGGEILIDRSLLQGAVAIGGCGEDDTLILSRGPLSMGNRMQKRALDLVITVPLLIVLAIPMLLVALVIRMETEGPALFRQVRVGQGNRQFRIFKFRSMRIERADASGARSTARDDDRITKVGRFIRRTSIDELPQLLNVLFGEMSLVGPRPHALGSLAGEALFWEVTESYWLRHALKPGITGLAQIRGFRGSTARAEDLEQRLRCDLEYLGRWTVWSDLMILLKTIRVVVHKNAY